VQAGCVHHSALKRDYNTPSALRELLTDKTTRCARTWDIEDLIQLAESQPHGKKFCPYFATNRVLVKDATLVICPYNYLLNPILRSSMDIHLEDAIVLLDEAHNIEDVCREAGSSLLLQSDVADAHDHFAAIRKRRMDMILCVTCSHSWRARQVQECVTVM
jgi:Fanconi anemia group J protein